MVLRETIRLRVAAQVMKPQRPGFGDQQPQDAVSGGQGTDPLGQFAVDPTIERIPVIVLTGDHEKELETKRLGVSFYLKKPVRRSLL